MQLGSCCGPSAGYSPPQFRRDRRGAVCRTALRADGRTRRSRRCTNTAPQRTCCHDPRRHWTACEARHALACLVAWWVWMPLALDADGSARSLSRRRLRSRRQDRRARAPARPAARVHAARGDGPLPAPHDQRELRAISPPLDVQLRDAVGCSASFRPTSHLRPRSTPRTATRRLERARCAPSTPRSRRVPLASRCGKTSACNGATAMAAPS